MWYVDGKLHRDDGPAVELNCFAANGYKAWYQNGVLQKENEYDPCVIDDGIVTWYKDGEIHRDGDFTRQ